MIQNNLIWFFTPSMRFAGIFLSLAGAFSIINQRYAGGILLIIGLLIFSTRSGIQLHYKEKKYKLYYSVLWLFHIGKFKRYERISGIRVHKMSMKYATYSRSNRHVENDFNRFVVEIEVQPGDQRVPMFSSKSKETTNLKAKEYAKVLN